MNNIVENLVQSAGTVLIVPVRNVVPTDNSFWVLYGQHTQPTFLEDAGNGQKLQRDNALSFDSQLKHDITRWKSNKRKTKQRKREINDKMTTNSGDYTE